MKTRTALKILRNCGYDKLGERKLSYNKQQVREAVRISVRDLEHKDKMNVYADYVSGGCNDTFRWRNEEWEEPWLNFETAHRIGQYMI